MNIVLGIILISFFATFIYAGLRGAPWVPTRKNDVGRFLKLADIKKGDVVYDIGCGNGRMIIAAAARGAKAIGLEVSLFPYLLAWINKLIKKSPAKILFRDLWMYDLADADTIYLFLTAEKMEKIKKKFKSELKKGTKVIAYVWPVTGWKPVKVNECEGYPKMYLYII